MYRTYEVWRIDDDERPIFGLCIDREDNLFYFVRVKRHGYNIFSIDRIGHIPISQLAYTFELLGEYKSWDEIQSRLVLVDAVSESQLQVYRGMPHDHGQSASSQTSGEI